MLMTISIVALGVVAILGVIFYRRFAAERIERVMERHRKNARLVTRGSFVDGNRRVDVALALDDSTFYYENSDTQGSIDLEWVREIEYANELATGGAVAGGKVLRLRSQSQVFEFVLPDAIVAKWHTMLPRRPTVASAASTQRYQAAAGSGL